MKSSNLAERLEEFAAAARLTLRDEPTTRIVAAPEAAASIDTAATLAGPRAVARRIRRTSGIVTRDSGLRPFRVG